jgi:glucose/arabinose dehydrogenase
MVLELIPDLLESKEFSSSSFKKKAGSSVPSANRITPTSRFRMATAWPSSDRRLISGLRSPFGMALVGKELFVANADSLVAVPFSLGQTQVTATSAHRWRAPPSRP